MPAESAAVVVDASVAVKWLIPEPDTPVANALQERWRREGTRILAPDLLLVEVANAVRRKAARGLIGPDAPVLRSSPDAWFPLEFVPTTGLLREALGLALAHQVTVYDAVYVALAVREGAPLYSADQDLTRRIPQLLAAVHGLSG